MSPVVIPGDGTRNPGEQTLEEVWRAASILLRDGVRGWVTRRRTPMFGNVIAPDGVHVTGKYRDRSMQHACWDSRDSASGRTRYGRTGYGSGGRGEAAPPSTVAGPSPA